MPADLVPASRAWMSDRPSWCVDHGATLEALTTCDLWLALARGDVTPETKVWREGMPYWDRIANVPEFALALPDSSVWEPAPRSAAPISEVRPAGSAAGSVEPLAGEPMAEESVTMDPACDLVTPAPVVVEERETVRPPSRPRRRAFPKIDRASALSVAIGATLAVLALTLATTVPAPGQDKASQAAAQHVAAGAPVRGVELPITTMSAASGPGSTDNTSAASAPTTANAMSATSASSAPTSKEVADAKAHGPRSLDRGQRRARMGTADRRQ